MEVEYKIGDYYKIVYGNGNIGIYQVVKDTGIGVLVYDEPYNGELFPIGKETRIGLSFEKMKKRDVYAHLL